ncbi:MAG: hypothetical protein EAZ32_18600 [Cytophagia bacterium]|nr:MAG: hypothetical protein EAZ38_01090 [Cytophagales bacterium]TAG35273.1 MAG: hypothetical protein EAZ32_18600 [Cytophagia bacterium]TAG51132.1 MAG: hypothetical protein EAZ29_10630 [Runella slithyformis]TAG68082.1 MAG: hypothetical protein EAZ26_08375 [Runella slithyformis]TAG77194.1 MAG: hypothetical protein EAZ22_16180 [Cytophagales bacterium]
MKKKVTLPTSSLIVDVAISVYGKPYQTAVTLLSLLKHSGQWIDKIYFIEERKQPKNTDFSFLYQLLGARIVRYVPRFWFWYNVFKYRFLLKWTTYRHSIRYQYAWEKSDKDYLLILHNDVLFNGDLVGAYLENLDENSLGIGKIGQCWNCPAYKENLCNGSKYWDYRPEKEALIEITKKHPLDRTPMTLNIIERQGAWPLPECRLNEYVALINLKKAKSVTIPHGKTIPFGVFDLDTGTRWFWEVSNMGYRVQNFDFESYAKHDWVRGINNGHEALLNNTIYQAGEAKALEKLNTDFGLNIKQNP